MPRKATTDSTDPVAAEVASEYVVLANLQHQGADWKKGDKNRFKKGDRIVLTDAEAAPLLDLGTVKAAE